MSVLIRLIFILSPDAKVYIVVCEPIDGVAEGLRSSKSLSQYSHLRFRTSFFIFYNY